MSKYALLIVAGMGFVLAAATTGVNAAAITIYSDNFDGTGDLNGTTPDVTTDSAKWVAVSGTLSDFNADGTFVGGGTTSANRGGSATLAFDPVDGLTYALDVSLANVATVGTDNDWVALGFAAGQSTAASSSSRFINNTVIAKAWMLARGNNTGSGGANTAFLGSATSGTADGVAWAGGPIDGGDIDLRIVLDTTAGAGAWTATWYARRPTDADYTKVRDTATLLDEGITSVGLAVSGDTITGTIESFALTSVPEPATLALLATGGLLVLRRRRG